MCEPITKPELQARTRQRGESIQENVNPIGQYDDSWVGRLSKNRATPTQFWKNISPWEIIKDQNAWIIALLAVIAFLLFINAVYDRRIYFILLRHFGQIV